MRTKNRLFGKVVLLAGALCMCFTASGAGTIILQDGFEDATTQGWAPFGTGTVTNSTKAARAGSHSLLSSGRTAAYNGPSLNLTSTLIPGATYSFSVAVRLVSGEAPTSVKMTAQRTPSSGAAVYEQVAASVNVTDSGWAILQGSYSFAGTPSSLVIYIESASATASYYIDDFVVTETAAPSTGPQDNSGITSTFEDGKTDGWGPRIGDETVAVTTTDSHTGKYSLLTTGRQHTYDGAAISVTNKMYNGSQYEISFWAKLTPGEATTQLKLTLQTNLGSNVSYLPVISATDVTSGGWVELSTVYNMGSSYDSAVLYVESNSATASFYLDDFSLTYIPPVQIQTDIPSVYQTLASYFPVGAAVDDTSIAGVHAQLLTKHFNRLTPGNAMKWDTTEPTEGNFNFADADRIVSFAKANNMTVRGHNLVWHSQIPNWVFLDAAGNPMTPTAQNKALLMQRMESHIKTEVTHFGDSVYAWDVVNEPIDETQPDGLRHSPWYTIIGPEYIDDAFRFARMYAPPDVELFINDYNTQDPARRSALFNLASGMKSRGVPIDGIGHEMHSNVQYPSPQSIVDAVNLFAGIGLDNQVTELDISVYTNNTDSFATIPDSLLAEQGYRYRDYFEAFRSLKGKLSSVTLWGLADDDTWLDTFPITRLDLPLLFDTKLQAKPAYWGVVDPSKLPGSALTAFIASKSGLTNHRVWQIQLRNPGVGIAYSATLNGFSLIQTAGAACSPVISSGFPLAYGDIASGGSASANVTIDFSSCSPLARFTLDAPYSSTYGANTGALVRNNQFR